MLNANGMADYTYNHSQRVDGDTRYGKAVGFPRRCCVGGTLIVRDNEKHGSRSMNSLWVTAYSGGDFSLKYII